MILNKTSIWRNTASHDSALWHARNRYNRRIQFPLREVPSGRVFRIMKHIICILKKSEYGIHDITHTPIKIIYLTLYLYLMQCQRGYGVKQLFSFLTDENNPPIMLIGGGCSVATEATAEASHYWNLNQVGGTLFKHAYQFFSA